MIQLFPTKISQKEKYEFHDDKELNLKIKNFNNSFDNSNSYDDKQTIEFFKIIYCYLQNIIL